MAASIDSTAIKILLILLFGLFLLLVFILANRRGRLLVAWIFTVLALILPPSLVVENEEPALIAVNLFLLPGLRPGDSLPWWADLLGIIIFFLPVFVFSLGAIFSTVLFYHGMELHLERARIRAGGAGDSDERRHRDRFAADSLVLSGLVLAVTLNNLYWALVLDRTTDSVGVFWLVFMAPVLLACVALLLRKLLPRATLAGVLFAILLPVSFSAVSFLAGRVDYRALTEARAERINRAFETYFAREDRYPENLGQLSPLNIFGLPGPVIIAGQDWCYARDESGYLFGYVDREHWSSPNLFGHLAGIGGVAEDLPQLCEAEIAAFREARGW